MLDSRQEQKGELVRLLESADTRNAKDDALHLCLLEPGRATCVWYMYVYVCRAPAKQPHAQFLDKSFYTYPFLISENFLRSTPDVDVNLSALMVKSATSLR